MAEKENPKDKAAPTDVPAVAATGNGGWLPVIVVLVLMPVLSYAMAEFVLFPRLEKRLAAVQGGEKSGGDEASHAGQKPAGGAEGRKGEPTFSYEFKDVVSNLAGSMRSRYIKVTFTAYSSEPAFTKIVDENKAKILDTTLSVLSVLSLADLEDPTIKNKVRNDLVNAYDGVLHKHVIEEIYFSEFVIQ